MNRKFYFTSESVSKGHPDKVADQISDAILDEYLKFDPNSKIACETLVTTNYVLISGEVNSTASIDVEPVIRNTIKEIGYDFEGNNFKWDTCEIINKLHQQSPDINQGVDLESGDIGAGDQGIMFGYAVDETDTMMPLSLDISNKLLLTLDNFREGIYTDYMGNKLSKEYLRPDAKSQVTLEYVDGKINKVDTILISTQHSPELDLNDLKHWIKTTLIPKTIEEYDLPSKLFYDYKLLVNPTGKFVIGGPDGDTGLTGRKIVVDQYGGRCPVGGGAFSGKDPSKVDRSAAYAARWLAKHIVGCGLAEECLVQLSYAIGVPEPTSIYINTYGTSKVDETLIEETIMKNISLKPKAIIDKLNLQKPIYKETAKYGHFGREVFKNEDDDFLFPWEIYDKELWELLNNLK